MPGCVRSKTGLGGTCGARKGTDIWKLRLCSGGYDCGALFDAPWVAFSRVLAWPCDQLRRAQLKAISEGDEY